MINRNKVQFWLGFFLLSFSVLYLEVLFTRIFSYVIWHNLAYMVISLAILGIGAGGVWDSIFVGNNKPLNHGWLSLFAAICVFFSFRVLGNFDFKWGFSGIFYVGFSSFLVFLPFFFMGLIIIRVFSDMAEQIGIAYSLNLAAGSCGAILALLLLRPLGMPKALIISCLILGISGLIFAADSSRILKIAAWFWIVFCASGLFWAQNWFHFKATSTKNYGIFEKKWPDFKREFSSWDPLGRIDVISSSDSKIKFNEESLFYRDLTNDGTSDTPLISFDGQLEKTGFFKGSLYGQAFAYYGRAPDKVLVIGVGGGPDVYSALHFGAKHVTGVEVNTTTLEALKKFLPELAGDPRVLLINSDGRNYVSRSKESFDIIQLTGVDTQSALEWGAYVQAENYIHTVEAYAEYLRHLAPGGVLSIGLPETYHPRVMLRACAMAVEALRNMGIKHPEQNIILVQQTFCLQMLVQKEPISKDSYARYVEEIQTNNYRGPITYAITNTNNSMAPMWVRYNPWSNDQKDTFAQLFNAVTNGTEKEFIRRYGFDISPVADDRPFFYYVYKPRLSLSFDKFLGNLVWFQLAEAAFFAGLFILLPMYSLRRKEIKGLKGNIWFFLLIGLGYMLIEIPFIQRFVLYLGHPVYSLVLVLVVLLAGSGLGAWLFHAFLRERKWAIWVSVLTIIFWSMLGLKLMPWLLAKALPSGLFATIMLAAGFTFILGVAMGIPFPAGVNALGKDSRDLVPWAWAINTSASVVSAILAVILAMSFGFTAVSVVAAAVYLLAGISYHLIGKSGA